MKITYNLRWCSTLLTSRNHAFVTPIQATFTWIGISLELTPNLQGFTSSASALPDEIQRVN